MTKNNERAAELVRDVLDALSSGSGTEKDIIDELRQAMAYLGQPWTPPDGYGELGSLTRDGS